MFIVKDFGDNYVLNYKLMVNKAKSLSSWNLYSSRQIHLFQNKIWKHMAHMWEIILISKIICSTHMIQLYCPMSKWFSDNKLHIIKRCATVLRAPLCPMGFICLFTYIFVSHFYWTWLQSWHPTRWNNERQ